MERYAIAVTAFHYLNERMGNVPNRSIQVPIAHLVMFSGLNAYFTMVFTLAGIDTDTVTCL